jgi:hypothetical protein
VVLQACWEKDIKMVSLAMRMGGTSNTADKRVEAFYVLERTFIVKSGKPFELLSLADVNEQILFGYFPLRPIAIPLIDELQRRHQEGNPTLEHASKTYGMDSVACMKGRQIEYPRYSILISHGICQESVSKDKIIDSPDYSKLEKMIIRRKPCKSISSRILTNHRELCWGHAGQHLLREDSGIHRHVPPY